MSTKLSTTRKPEVIANEIVRLSNRMLEDAIEVGRRFVELKAAVPYGEWGKWLEYTGYKKSSADNMMRLFNAYGAEELSLFGNVKSQTFGKLGYSKALALLAVPEEEREEFAQEVDAEHLSVRQLKAEIKARDEKLAEAQNQAEGWKLKAEQARADAELAQESAEKREKELKLTEDQLSGLRENERALKLENSRLIESKNTLQSRVAELESRPTEVAVETVDATAEQIAEAEARGRNQGLSEAADKIEAAEKHWRELNAKLEAERDEANDTVACLGKQLDAAEAKSAVPAASQRTLTEINVLLRNMQGENQRLKSLLAVLDDITQARVRGAVSKVLETMLEEMK